MNAALSVPQRAPPLVRFAAKLLTRGPAVMARELRKRALRSAWLRGRERGAQRAAEPADPAIVATGAALRDALLAAYERRHARSNYRVLMLVPNSITAEIWFGGLARCLRHAGVECELLPPRSTTAGISAAIERFAPNVFVATEGTDALSLIDLGFLRAHKRAHGCLRQFVPVWHARAPGHFSTPAEDAWRTRLRRNGLTADVHFSIFEPEFHDLFSRDADGPAVEYLAVPQACDPFHDYPLAADKIHDYFMAGSMVDDRVAVSYRYLRPVLSSYRGLWCGARWGFGDERGVPPEQMPLRYAQSRIALSPLVDFVHRHGAEVTHRVYAAAGCGAFQITMPTAITQRYFRADELVQAKTPVEYARLFAHYIDRPDERNAIALAGLRRAYSEHTCFHRIDRLVAHWDAWRARGMF